MDSINGYGGEVTCFTSYHIHLHHRLPAGSDEYLGTRFIHSRPPAIVASQGRQAEVPSEG